MSRQLHPSELVRVVHVEALERALLDGVRLDEVPLDEVPDVLDALDLPLDPDADPRGAGDRVRVDLGLVPVFSDERPLLGLAGLIDWRGSGRLSGLIRSGFCTAAAGEQLLVPCDRRLPIDRLVLVGLGPRAEFDEARARAVASQLVKISTGLQARTVLIALPTQGIDRALAEAVFEALLVEIEQLVTSAPTSQPDPLDDAQAAAEQAGELAGELAGESAPEQPGELAPELAPELAAEPVAPESSMLDPDAPAAKEVAADAPQEPTGDPPGNPEPDSGGPELPSSLEPEAPALASPDDPPDLDVTTARWWVAVDQAVVARLRRVLSGPPRAARGGSNLHT
ncbi:hypothetical protein DB30_00480 [Enhygromyxa salina]|uniref:Peptidase M17 leucyl aminopeptidase N-terminal domain-containing protein n=1 Tax=Enhygromyxa salina TaxID=215803 RepID=A0A0C2CZ85_9BACT|nr:M17 family peptidase N-terminal domain-containing protein [Enhygromyxa salina]KIG13172.1 hypothetical protein DB30_00480 [Enhygromyxa salina]